MESIPVVEFTKAVILFSGAICAVMIILPWVVFAFERYFKWCAKKMNEWK